MTACERAQYNTENQVPHELHNNFFTLIDSRQDAICMFQRPIECSVNLRKRNVFSAFADWDFIGLLKNYCPLKLFRFRIP